MEDALGIAKVHVNSWRSGYQGLMPQEFLDNLSVEKRTKGWEDILSKIGDYQVFVALNGTEIVGFCSAGVSRDSDVDKQLVGELYAIYVDPKHWLSGAGSLLIQAAIDLLRTQGYNEATLWVLDTNARGIGFYTAKGWQPDGATKVDTLRFSLANYFRQLAIGFKELAVKPLRPYLLAFVLLSGIFFMYESGLLRPSMAAGFGFDGVNQSLALALVTLVAGLSLVALPAVRRLVNDRWGMVLLQLVLVIGFAAAALPLGIVGGFTVLCIIAVGGTLATPWISIIINKEIQSKYRATTISTLALFTKLPYVLTAIITGVMIEQGNLSTFTLLTAAILFVGAAITVVLSRAY